MSATRLKPDGKPMRALRGLGRATGPLDDWEVWVLLGSQGEWAPCSHALGRLVALGLAERSGKRGNYRWVITTAGREALRDG